MKIATNVHRDAFGGITVSNLALFDWLKDRDDTIVGIEIITARHILGATIFRNYLPSFFSHHIINGLDVFSRYNWEKVGGIEKHWKVLIETTKNILRSEQPDVVLINGTYYSPWILAQAAKELGIPIVLRYAGVLKREVAHKNIFIRQRLLAYERSIADAADVIIYPSVICQKVVEEEILKHPSINSLVVPNPANRHLVSKNQNKGRYTIASIGRWSQIKNFQSYIALHEELLKEHWPHRAIMVTSYWDNKFHISETIERKEPMSQPDLFKFYCSIDLLVVTSHFETFCNVAAEALVNGASVLVSKNVGFSEILIKAGLKRMVIDSFDDPVKVASVVKRLAKNKLTSKERQAVAKLLDPHLIHGRILDVLQKAIIVEVRE